MQESTAVRGVGDNSQANSDSEKMRADLLEKYDYLVKRKIELEAGATNVPEEIPEEEAGKVADFVKQITGHIKAINGTRQTEKEPHLERGRLVDGIFKSLSDPLETLKKAIEAKLGVTLRKKEDRARAEAAEKARLEREEQERRRVAAEEAAAEDRRRAAEAQRLAEEAEKKRDDERKRLAAEESARQKKAKEEQEAHDRAIAEAAARKKAAEEAEEESKRKRARQIREAEEAERAAVKAKEAAEKQQREEAAEIERKRLVAEREAKREIENAARQVAAADRQVARSEKVVAKEEQREETAIAKEERVENAKPADFARSRGDYGAVGTLSEKWICTNIDRATLDLEKLRNHIPTDGLERAVNSFIRAGERDLAGATIVLEATAGVR